MAVTRSMINCSAQRRNGRKLPARSRVWAGTGRSPGGRFNAESAKPLVDQLIDALAAAHVRGEVHRDQKTGDLRYARKRRLVVVDALH